MVAPTDSNYLSASRLPARPDPPDPLTTLDGKPIESGDEWWSIRRPEIRRLIRHYVYGYAPDSPAIDTETTRTEGALGNRATLTQTTIQYADAPDAPTIRLALFTPTDADSVPTFLALNGMGNHAIVADEAVTVTDSADGVGEDQRGTRKEFWCVERLIQRGYGFATIHQADVDPDHDDFTDGVHPHFDVVCPPGTEWGTLAAWAWGLQRGVDRLRTDDLVEADRIAVCGHSRRGKAALLAGATDERVAMVVPHQSGTGGTTLTRGNTQETLGAINREFPHWFNDIFAGFTNRAERLPVDQHLLVALVAPRPLLDVQGARDYWTNPGLALDALRGAAPAYELFDVEGALAECSYERLPSKAGVLHQYRRETGHTLNKGYWQAICDFADQHL